MAYRKQVEIGRKYERLEVVREVAPINGRRRVLCKCDCGNETVVDRYKLEKGVTKSCGCLGRERLVKSAQRQAKDLTGKVFGKLTVLRRDGDKKANRSPLWLCECECGNVISVSARDLTHDNTKSCGCVNKKRMQTMQEYNEDQHYVEGVFAPLLEQKVQTNSKTGKKGVSIYKTASGRERYVANITVGGKRHYLGIHDTQEEAAQAREAAEKELYGPILDEYEKVRKRDDE